MAVNHARDILGDIDNLAARVRDLEGARTIGAQAPKLISRTALAGTAASVTFSAVPAYNYLQLFWRAQLSAAGPTDMLVQVDGNSAASYLWGKLSGHNAVASQSDGGGVASSAKFGVVGGTTANYFSNGVLTLAGWASATGFLTMSGSSCTWNTATSNWEELYSAQFDVAGPHTSLTIFPGANSFAAGSQFSLYGVN